jgi:WD40 repeat protein
MLEFNEQGSGMCIDFHPQNPKIYLCGTEEGMVHKCTTEYSSKYLYSSEAHAGGVMVIKWNPFHEDVYATCGQDWTLKLWNQVSSTTKDDILKTFRFDLSSV